MTSSMRVRFGRPELYTSYQQDMALLNTTGKKVFVAVTMVVATCWTQLRMASSLGRRNGVVSDSAHDGWCGPGVPLVRSAGGATRYIPAQQSGCDPSTSVKPYSRARSAAVTDR